MSTTAIIMMLVAMAIIWGGLVASIINLRSSPSVPQESDYHRDL